MNIATHDGYGSHHVAEICFEATPTIQLLWQEDKEAYVHSVSNLLHSLLLCDKVRVPPATRNEDVYGPFLTELARNQLYHEDTSYKKDTPRKPGGPAFEELVRCWQFIKDLVRDDPRLKGHLAGHLRRDVFFRNRKQDWPHHYYLRNKKIVLHKTDEDDLLQSQQAFFTRIGKPFDLEVERAWLRPNIATHFLNFFEQHHSAGAFYVAGLTRVPVIAHFSRSVPPLIDKAIRSLAYDMVKDASHRKELLDCATTWIHGRQGKKYRTRFRELYSHLDSRDENEANRCVDAINRIDEAEVSRPFDIIIKAINLGLGYFKPETLADRGRQLAETQQPGYLTMLSGFKKSKDDRLKSKLAKLIKK